MNTISKHLFVVLGAAASLAAPLGAQAAPPAPAKKAASTANQVPRGAGERGDRRVVYYITNTTATGSHIPVVVQRYQGTNTYLNSGVRIGSAYDSRDISTTGSLSVGGALTQLDPAISSVGTGVGIGNH